MKFIIIGCILIVFIFLLIRVLKIKELNRVIQVIQTIFENQFKDISIRLLKKQTLIIDTCHHHFLIKLLRMPPQNELVITNRDTWFKKKKSQDLFIQNQVKWVQEFMNFKSSKEITKLVLILNPVRNILMYINESEMVIVRPHTSVYGCHIMEIDELISFLRREKK